MGVEAFDFAELDDRRERFLQGFGVEVHEAGAALEHVDGEAGESLARAAGGQRVAGAGEEIARRHRREAAEENRARGVNARGDLVLVLGDDGDVLGREVVGDRDAALERLDENEGAAVFQLRRQGGPGG